MAAEMVEEGSKENRIMVVIDENESSCCYALKWVLQNLQESVIKSSNPLFLFMVLPPASASATNATGAEADSDSSSSILEKAKSICFSHGIDAEIITVVGGGGKEAICEGVKKYKINLLVLSDHTIGKFKRTILGSVSNYCVSNAKCSVLLVKRPP